MNKSGGASWHITGQKISLPKWDDAEHITIQHLCTYCTSHSEFNLVFTGPTGTHIQRLMVLKLTLLLTEILPDKTRAAFLVLQDHRVAN